ncbi:MAG: hypothetical protein JXQ26_02165 [Tissierellales bacterium]|nr:hypothetical protein [Tissierellales bacterium]
MTIQLNTWNGLLFLTCISMICVQTVRIVWVFFRKQYMEKRGYQNVMMARLGLIFEALSSLLFFAVLGVRLYCELGNENPFSEAFLDSCFTVAWLSFTVSIFFVSGLKKKYGLSNEAKN